MPLYLIQCDRDSWYVEQPTLSRAIEVWKTYIAAETDTSPADIEDPESIAMLSEEGVIRSAYTPS